ncbi:MAG: hypothetical protein Crog4KO_06250 [Crocinitomicaceae bacterium]
MQGINQYFLLNIKSYCLAVFILCSLATLGQNTYEEIFSDSIKEVSFSCGIVYLPSPQSEFISLTATPTKIKAKYFRYKKGRFFKSKRKRNINISESEFTRVYQLYTSLRSPIVDFSLSEKDKDSLRAFLKDTSYNGTLIYNLGLEQLEEYISNDSIQIDMSVFASDSLNNHLHPIIFHGAPFRFRMTIVNNNNDTTSHIYDGNLVGSDRYRDLSNHLIFSSLHSELKLYKYLPTNEYFSRSNFLRAILQYIEGKEGLMN